MMALYRCPGGRRLKRHTLTIHTLFSTHSHHPHTVFHTLSPSTHSSPHTLTIHTLFSSHSHHPHTLFHTLSPSTHSFPHTLTIHICFHTLTHTQSHIYIHTHTLAISTKTVCKLRLGDSLQCEFKRSEERRVGEEC